MSNSIYSEPQSTASVLYLEVGYYNNLSFGDLAQAIADHFGENVTLDQFTITAERIQVRGCSCCNDSSDYEQYLVINNNHNKCDRTDPRPVVSLSVN